MLTVTIKAGFYLALSFLQIVQSKVLRCKRLKQLHRTLVAQ